MSTDGQAWTDAGDIHRDKNDKGQDGSSDAKAWDARPGIDAEFGGGGNEVCADTQDDEGKYQCDAWRSPEYCELIARLRDTAGWIAHQKRRGGRG